MWQWSYIYDELSLGVIRESSSVFCPQIFMYGIVRENREYMKLCNVIPELQKFEPCEKKEFFPANIQGS